MEDTAGVVRDAALTGAFAAVAKLERDPRGMVFFTPSETDALGLPMADPAAGLPAEPDGEATDVREGAGASSAGFEPGRERDAVERCVGADGLLTAGAAGLLGANEARRAAAVVGVAAVLLAMGALVGAVVVDFLRADVAEAAGAEIFVAAVAE